MLLCSSGSAGRIVVVRNCCVASLDSLLYDSSDIYRVGQKNTIQSFAHDTFLTVRRRITLFVPKCSVNITVYQSTQNCVNLLNILCYIRASGQHSGIIIRQYTQRPQFPKSKLWRSVELPFRCIFTLQIENLTDFYFRSI